MTRVLVCGLVTADCLFELPAIPVRAEKYRADNAQIVCGGGGANAAVAIARLQGEAVLLGRVGDDLLGNFSVSQLQRAAVDVSQLQRVSGARTAFSSVIVDAHGERQVVNYRGAGFNEGATLAAIDGHYQSVLVDARWPRAALHALRYAQAQGVPAVVDAEAPVLVDALSLATHIAFSRQGLHQYAGTDELAPALRQAAHQSAAWVCVTDGPNGVYLLEQDELLHVPAFTVQAVDTLGAGDVWHGAFTLQLARGVAETQAVVFANAVAALKCMQRGGGFVSPQLHVVEQFIKTARTC